MKSFARPLAALAIGVMFGTAPSLCSAEIVEGQAPIIDGNVDQARYAARQDAMRIYVEGKVGVHVQSSTEVDMGMVVSDRILTNSNGYVQLKRVVDEKQANGIYRAELIFQATTPEDQAKVWCNKALWKKLDLLTGYEAVNALLMAGEKEAVLSLIDQISGYELSEEDVAKN